MTNYVCGFATDGKYVLLMKKARGPECVVGLLNGVGGKVEDADESEYSAMAREFQEETGFGTRWDDWVNFATIEGGAWRVFFFTFRTTQSLLDSCRNPDETEPLRVVRADMLQDLKVVPNLRWLVPLGLDSNIVVSRGPHCFLDRT